MKRIKKNVKYGLCLFELLFISFLVFFFQKKKMRMRKREGKIWQYRMSWMLRWAGEVGHGSQINRERKVLVAM